MRPLAETATGAHVGHAIDGHEWIVAVCDALLEFLGWARGQRIQVAALWER